MIEYKEYGGSAFPGHGSVLYHPQPEMKKLKRKNEELRKGLNLIKKLQVFLEERMCKV